MSFLADFKSERTEAILRLSLSNLKKHSRSIAEFKKFEQQLIFLTRIRKLDKQILKIIEDMPLVIDIENHALFQKGVTQGLEKGKNENRNIMFKILDFLNKGISIDKIQEETGESIETIKKLKQDLFE